MDLEPGGKEACDRGKQGRHAAAYNQRQHNPQADRNAGEVKHVAEQRAGVDALVHDHRGQHHAGAHHAAHRQIRAAQQDQAADAQCQEHARGRGLQDIQDIVHRQQLGMLDDRRQNAQENEDEQNGNIKPVLQEELLHIERILVILPLLFLLLGKREF